MSLNDPLANALSHIFNCEKKGKQECTIKPVSKTIKKILDMMKEKRFIGEYEFVEDGKGGFLKINLLGRINRCGVIKPRFSVKKDGIEKYEKRFLLAKGFGFLMISTNKGIITNEEVTKNNIGGRLIAYCY